MIAGNWKMNMTPTQAKDLIEAMKPAIGKAKWCDIVLCVPFTDIQAAVKAAKGSRISVGAQNMHEEEKGAYTGEISAAMLIDSGVRYVIIGHSERREYFGETDEKVNRKAAAAVAAGLRPIICVGESLDQRETGVTIEHIRMQIKAAVKDLTERDLKKVIFAYEPIWAIGTGRTATSEQADEVCREIRACLRELYGARAARAVSILYGGSMNAKNAESLLAMPDVDGGLIGGASLKAEDFAAIVNAANQ